MLHSPHSRLSLHPPLSTVAAYAPLVAIFKLVECAERERKGGFLSPFKKKVTIGHV